MNVRSEETKRGITLTVSAATSDGDTSDVVVTLSVQCARPGTRDAVNAIFDRTRHAVADELGDLPTSSAIAAVLELLADAREHEELAVLVDDVYVALGRTPRRGRK